jgi:DNA gyrase subunit A
MTLADDNDEVIGMITMTGKPNETVMVVSSNGYGKRSDLEGYRITNRGGKGVKTMAITDKTGELVAIKNVDDTNDLMIINQSGITLRLPVANIRVMGRATQGVKLIDLTKRGDVIASVCKVSSDPEEVPEEAEEDAVSTIKAPVDDANADAEVSNEAIDEVDETEEVQSSIFDEETLRKIEEPQDDSENKE